MTVSLGPYLLSTLWNSEVSSFQGFLIYINIRKMRSGLHVVFALQWMFVFQGVRKVRLHCMCLYVSFEFSVKHRANNWSTKRLFKKRHQTSMDGEKRKKHGRDEIKQVRI